MKKLAILLSLVAGTAFGCWYEKGNYTDYIYGVNGTPIIHTNVVNGVSHYAITNNLVVDFPISVTMKLMSDEVIDIGGGATSSIGNITGKLQYRVLPGGDWVTVSEFNTPTGKIAKDSEPLAYFGQNNIWPRGCKAGDVVMIRMYVTDGMWQSGNLNNRCTGKLRDETTPYGSKLALPSIMSYDITGAALRSVDLGGSWYPHFAITVVYSGKTRPIH